MLNTGTTVEALRQLLENALSIELDRELAEADDSEGKPLSYTPPPGSPLSSPLSSPPLSTSSSPLSSPPSSPLQAFTRPEHNVPDDDIPALSLSPQELKIPLSSPSLSSSRPLTEHAAPKKTKKPRTRRRGTTHTADKAKAKAPPPTSLPSVTDSVPTASTSSHKASLADDADSKPNHAQRGYYQRRARKRQAGKSVPKDPSKYKIRSSLSRKSLGVAPLKTTFDLAHLNWAKGAFIGLREPIVQLSPSLEALLEQGFQLYKWDGW